MAAGLSVVQGNLLHEQVTLEGGQDASWMVPMKAGEDYLVDTLCVGSGDVVLELPDGFLTALPCDGSIGSTFLYRGRPDRVTLRRVTGDPVVGRDPRRRTASSGSAAGPGPPRDRAAGSPRS